MFSLEGGGQAFSHRDELGGEGCTRLSLGLRPAPVNHLVADWLRRKHRGTEDTEKANARLGLVRVPKKRRRLAASCEEFGTIGKFPPHHFPPLTKGDSDESTVISSSIPAWHGCGSRPGLGFPGVRPAPHTRSTVPEFETEHGRHRLRQSRAGQPERGGDRKPGGDRRCRRKPSGHHQQLVQGVRARCQSVEAEGVLRLSQDVRRDAQETSTRCSSPLRTTTTT